jgi:HSP20 family protein
MARTALPAPFPGFDRLGASGPARRDLEGMLRRLGLTDALAPMPAIDIAQGDEAVTVTADVPGWDPDALEVSLEGDVMTISGHREEDSEDAHDGYTHRERRRGRFARVVRLGFAPGEDAVSSTLRDGVLTVRVARPAEDGPARRKVTISRD